MTGSTRPKFRQHRLSGRQDMIAQYQDATMKLAEGRLWEDGLCALRASSYHLHSTFMHFAMFVI